MPRRKKSNSRNEQQEQQPQQRSVAAHVRERQRAVAEREAARLARPEARPQVTLGHADRKKSAVSSTPSGILYVPKITTAAENSTEWCGPFSVARQMIAKREEARRLRDEESAENKETHPLDEAMQELEMEKKRKAHPSMQWKGSLKNDGNASLYSKRQRRMDVQIKGRAVPSLFDLCVQFLVDNFEHVESLGDIDSQIRTAITNQLVANGKLDGESFASIAEPGVEALEVVDCSSITDKELCDRLVEILPAGLKYLALDQCGRCFHTKAVETITNNKDKCDLFALSIGGAYVLKDNDAARLIESTTPSSIEFKACPLIGRSLCESISTTYTTSSKSTMLLELALEDVNLSQEDLMNVLLAKSDAFINLKSLSLRRIGGLNDEIVNKFIEYSYNTLEGLDLADNPQLTDNVLSSLRQFPTNNKLRALSLSGLKQLSAAGLEALFMPVDGATPPPQLRTLNLEKCDHEAVTDEVIQLAVQAATQTANSTGLVRLNVQGSTLLTDVSMEELARKAHTLEELNVSFCPKITDKGLGYLVDNVGRQLTKLHLWGNAQLTDEFFDGHSRTNDPGLAVYGVWMKKHTSRTIR